MRGVAYRSARSESRADRVRGVTRRDVALASRRSTDKLAFSEATRMHFHTRPTRSTAAARAEARRPHCGRHAAAAAARERPSSTRIYELPYTRRAHPSYQEPIPATSMIKHSVTDHARLLRRLHFCSITMHQGKTVQSRSEGSVLARARAHRRRPGLQGRHQRHRRPDRQHVPAALHASRGREVPSRLSCVHPTRSASFSGPITALSSA
jgi:hypothetical protein